MKISQMMVQSGIDDVSALISQNSVEEAVRAVVQTEGAAALSTAHAPITTATMVTSFQVRDCAVSLG